MSFVQNSYVNNNLNVNNLATFNGDVTMSANAVIVGNLDVQGTTTSIDSANVNIKDRHLYLNKDYTANVGKTAGLVVNYLPTLTSSSIGTGGFDTTSSVQISNLGSFEEGDIIQISGTDNIENDGLFVVASNSETTLVIDTASDFAQTAFVVDSGTNGTITKVEVSILQTSASGAWETTFGSKLDDIAANNKSIILSGGSSANTSLTLSNDANQIVFSHAETDGTDFPTTLNVVEPAAARVITLPDPGNDANIILSLGTQNLSGAYTVAPNGSLNIDTAATLSLDGTDNNYAYTFAVSDLTENRTVTLPLLTTSDTFVFENHDQTLTNKTIIDTVTEYNSVGPHVLGNDGGRVNTVTHSTTATVTLPTPVNGTKYTIINTSTGAPGDQDVVINASGSDKIDDYALTSLTLDTKGQRVTLQYIATQNNWFIV